MTKWKYEDATGVFREGTYSKCVEGQGTDVTYFFIRDDGKLDLVSGARLQNMVSEVHTKAFDRITAVQ